MAKSMVGKCNNCGCVKPYRRAYACFVCWSAMPPLDRLILMADRDSLRLTGLSEKKMRDVKAAIRRARKDTTPVEEVALVKA